MSTLVSLKPKLGWVSSELFDDRMDSSFYLSQIELGLDKIFNKKDIKLLTLEDITRRIVDGPFGSAVLANDYVSEGIPFLRVQNVTDYGLNLDDVIFISKECNKRIARSQAVKGNIVFTKTGWLGNTCVLTSEYDVYNIRGDLAVLECKDDVDPYYISTYLNSSFGKKVTSSFGSGSTRPRILLSNIRKIPVPIPSEKIQSYIGNKVRKAEKLREEAKRLKEEAEEILFNELRIKELEHLLMEQNKKYNWVEETALTERIDAYYYKAKYTILDKFISQFEYVITKKIADVEYGYMPQEDYTEVDSGIPIIRITNMPGNLLIDSSDIKHIPVNEKIKDRHFVRENDILMVQLGDTTGKVAYVSKEFDGYLFPSFCLKISLKDTNKVLPGYLALLYESKIMQLQIEQTISYASVRPNTTKPAIESLKIPIVEMSKQKEIADRILNYIKHIYESKHLIIEAKQDVEDLIEGKFDESKISEGV